MGSCDITEAALLNKENLLWREKELFWSRPIQERCLRTIFLRDEGETAEVLLGICFMDLPASVFMFIVFFIVFLLDFVFVLSSSSWVLESAIQSEEAPLRPEDRVRIEHLQGSSAACTEGLGGFWGGLKVCNKAGRPVRHLLDFGLLQKLCLQCTNASRPGIKYKSRSLLSSSITRELVLDYFGRKSEMINLIVVYMQHSLTFALIGAHPRAII